MPAVRRPDPAGGVHEPVVVLLPSLPAAPPRPPLNGMRHPSTA